MRLQWEAPIGAGTKTMGYIGKLCRLAGARRRSPAFLAAKSVAVRDEWSEHPAKSHFRQASNATVLWQELLPSRPKR